jgi:hypothetical protein
VQLVVTASQTVVRVHVMATRVATRAAIRMTTSVATLVDVVAAKHNNDKSTN